MEITFEVYPGDKGEKKHSRRYGAIGNPDDLPLRDIYVMRPFANDRDTLVIEIKED